MDGIEPSQYSQSVKKKGFTVSRNIVRKLLNKHGYVKRKMVKSKPTGEFKERDRQFRKITRLRAKHERAGNPVVSVDTKRKRDWAISTVTGRFFALRRRMSTIMITRTWLKAP